MIRTILLICLWILAVGLLQLFGNDSGTFVILVGSVIYVGLSVITFFVVGTRIQPALVLPDACAKGEAISGELIIMRNRWASIFGVYCMLVCENTLTGEKEMLEFHDIKNTTPFTLQTSHCGVLRIRAENFLILDPLGLFSRKLSCMAEGHVIVPPTGFDVSILLTDTAQSLDSDEYSTSKAGMDVSETYAIREYHPGDPIRSIHWKLTEKLDKVMVREFGLPIGNAVLLVLDIAGDAEISPAGLDATMELFFSASLALLGEGVHTTMGWQSAESGGFVKHELRTPEDAAVAIRECLLTVDVQRNAQPVYEYNAFEKVLIIFGGDTPEIKGAS